MTYEEQVEQIRLEIRRGELLARRTRLFNLVVSSVATIIIVMSVATTLYIAQEEQKRPFVYVGDRNDYGVVIYKPDVYSLCPGDTLRYSIWIETVRPEIDVTVKYKFVDSSGANLGEARYEERVLDRPFLFLDQVREEPIPEGWPPGEYRLVGGATTQNTSSDMYAVPFELGKNCEAYASR